MSFESTYKELKSTRRKGEAAWHPVLSLPIRNWNLFIAFTHSVQSFSFESTYKELKFMHKTKKPSTSDSFESTYKELKSRTL